MTDHQELDIVLRQWGSQARTAVSQQPMPELTPRVHSSRHFGWQLAAGVTAVAVAAVVAVGLPKLLAKNSGDADPLRGITSTASAPAGFQVITFHGLSITVPASWQVNNGNYCQLTGSVIELPTSVEAACRRPPYLDLTIVDFLGGTQPLPPESVRSSMNTTISGLPATRVEGSAPRPAIGYIVPRLSVSVLIQPAAGQTGEDLAASLAVHAVDSHGCPARITDGDTFPPPATAGRPGAAETLIPGQPTSMSACRYVLGWLNQGATVSGAALRAFVSAVNGLPPGLSQAADLGLVTCTGTPDRDHLPPLSDPDVYRFQLRYPSGPLVLLSARAGVCGKSGVANGRRTGQLTEALSQLLIHTAGYQAVAPFPVVPAR